MSSKTFAIFIFITLHCTVFAQRKSSEFLFPIRPGQANGLAGTVGELRATHFHTGLDIKTGNRVGLPVHASMDGYISRIFVSSGGYGLALYIKHPNGYTTVYAHLLSFREDITDYVLSEQYRRKTFHLNLYPGPEKFRVKKGEVIARSGNSGSSTAPHLHWDVRDPYQRPVNSLEAGFEEITDNIPPLIRKVAFISLDETGRINGQFGRYEFRVGKSGDTYHLAEPVTLEGNVGLEILGYDKLNGFNNLCGISRFELRHNGRGIFRSHLEKLSFSKQRSIYRYYNYRERIRTGERFHTLYIADGNDLDFYPNPPLRGWITSEENRPDTLSGSLHDPYGNKVNFEFVTGVNVSENDRGMPVPQWEVIENHIHLRMPRMENNQQEPLLLYEGGEEHAKTPYYQNDLFSYYLIDLRDHLPDSLRLFDLSIITNLKDRVPPGRNYTYFGKSEDITFSRQDLFDTLYLATSYIQEENREVFVIGDTEVPLNKAISVTLKPQGVYTEEKWSVYSLDDRNNMYFQGGIWQDGEISFSTRYFGRFTLAKDTVPPTIRPLRISRTEVSFRIRDNLSGVDDYHATIDGKWLLMYYDAKSDRIWSVLPEGITTLSGELVLTVTDNEGNKQSYTTKL